MPKLELVPDGAKFLLYAYGVEFAGGKAEVGTVEEIAPGKFKLTMKERDPAGEMIAGAEIIISADSATAFLDAVRWRFEHEQRGDDGIARQAMMSQFVFAQNGNALWMAAKTGALPGFIDGFAHSLAAFIERCVEDSTVDSFLEEFVSNTRTMLDVERDKEGGTLLEKVAALMAREIKIKH